MKGFHLISPYKHITKHRSHNANYLALKAARFAFKELNSPRYLTSMISNKILGTDSKTSPSYKDVKCSWTDKRQNENKCLTRQIVHNKSKTQNWELTVGIEIHALLNTERKLFSPALSTINQKANTHVAFFDFASPGSQPIFQKEALIPAIRAALILNSNIQSVSKFDRKHYFHWDQPAGYQITQYYDPYAKGGFVTLYAHDGIAKEDGDQIRVGIKQIQLEQDTAKTISKPEGNLLDFNRVGLPLIEIITLPDIRYPKTAAALVRKIQTLLNSVDACVIGMESGGLRADINVSVRRCSDVYPSSMGIDKKNFGQKIEIKNLSSFKSIEDAIVAERDRQISILESGASITSETRGWAIGATETKMLRKKEGEIDYRYMPDPDLPPIVIGSDVIAYLRSTIGMSPDEEIDLLIKKYGISAKDAMTLTSLENGGRIEFFYKVVENLQLQLPQERLYKLGKLCSNWVLHDMASLRHDDLNENDPLQLKADGTCIIPPGELATLLFLLETNKILRKPAKYALQKLFTYAIEKKPTNIREVIEKEDLWNQKMSEKQYKEQAQIILAQYQDILKTVISGNESKIKALLGMMLKNDRKGVMDPKLAEQVLKQVIDEFRKNSTL
ncbi:Glutamyl-tRNA amidotransferase subunit B, mitochondrial [Erysiphe neolycopersici]|uniref:Glutamyl-tRNA(Gln) amidotransferase subunit B, mitochondrial n=1 Tax=Erysiphe neolycopersici TaxID=212602 RepID=A0A420HE52_9PEZI|nr:Glutamyl-tRNA amidotransferase subunit B, mitochondrial [Erysiphe neolycopersici]